MPKPAPPSAARRAASRGARCAPAGSGAAASVRFSLWPCPRDPSTAQPCGSAPALGLREGGGEGGEGRTSPWAARSRGRLPSSQGRRKSTGPRARARAKSRCASLRCLRHLLAAWAGVPTPAAPRGGRPRALRRFRCAPPPPVRAPHAALALSRFPKVGKPGGHAPRPAGGPAPTPAGIRPLASFTPVCGALAGWGSLRPCTTGRR